MPVAPPAFPFLADHALHPATELAEARLNQGPIRIQPRYGAPCWLVTRYEEARFVMSSPAFSRDRERVGISPEDVARVTPMEVTSGTFAAQDPPDHTRLRRFIYRTFTPNRVEALRPGTQEIADRLVGEMAEKGPPLDLYKRFGLILPVEVICNLLGVPSSDRERFTHWTEGVLLSEGTPERAAESVEQMNAYLAGQAALRRRQPTDDLIGALVRARVEGDRLSDDEITNLLRILLGAGHETTASQIPNFVYLLLTGDGYTALVDRPELVRTAVDELLRFTPLLTQGSLARFVLTDVEVGGTLLRAGDQVLIELAAANRDPDAFADPETLDLGRKDNPHIAFGHGLHRCVGASLARMELQVALATLTRRLPDLRLARPAGEVDWLVERFVRRPKELEVTW
ncbi:cytochrome P450 [Actinomadura sp. NEAU-AAG7]|uniref:cytochrome P450 n=1 Tax=Actinomadura sp. NEAU-AAG7 TaxID=2839640 RepID=UPI001BE4B544|nr:cytochrome P450 [Actinomadura sp. NEAU-AAG7]MBT2208781.1 cytochrome P450 [Actinomadura sp. NEAU-AAG7]